MNNSMIKQIHANGVQAKFLELQHLDGAFELRFIPDVGDGTKVELYKHGLSYINYSNIGLVEMYHVLTALVTLLEQADVAKQEQELFKVVE